MISAKDIQVPDGKYPADSLSKLIGKPIADVIGSVTDAGYGTYVFKISKVIFKDGTFLYVEGEHDFPYLVESNTLQPNFDDETLERIYKEKYGDD